MQTICKPYASIGADMTTIGVFAAIFDEQGRILCVKRNYGPMNWTTPGGGMEAGESPLEALEREVREETGYLVRAGRCLGVYAATYKDDLVLSIEAEITDQEKWEANQEISHTGFFAEEELPLPMNAATRKRIQDAFNGRIGIIRAFASAAVAEREDSKVRKTTNSPTSHKRVGSPNPNNRDL